MHLFAKQKERQSNAVINIFWHYVFDIGLMAIFLGVLKMLGTGHGKVHQCCRTPDHTLIIYNNINSIDIDFLVSPISNKIRAICTATVNSSTSDCVLYKEKVSFTLYFVVSSCRPVRLQHLNESHFNWT